MNTKIFDISRAWKFLGFLTVLYFVGDLLRKVFGISSIVYIISDLLLICFYVLSFLQYLHYGSQKNDFKIKWPVRKNFLLGLAIFCILLAAIISTLNAGLNSLFLSGLGLRTYLIALPMMLIGYSNSKFLRNPNFAAKLDKFLTPILIFVVSISLLQSVGGFIGLDILPSLEHSYHSFYSHHISLVSSVFVSSKKFARFLLFLFIIIWMARNVQGRKMAFLSMLSLYSIYVSGSREAFFLMLIFLLVDILFFSKSYKKLNISQGVWRLIITVSVSGMFVSLLVFIQRIQFMFATDNPFSFIQRGLQLFPLFWFDWSNSSLLFGNGPGSYGQEKKLVAEVDQSINQLDGYVSSTAGIGDTVLHFLDSGLTRIIMELGLLGLIGYSFFLFYLFWMVRRDLFNNQCSVRFACAWIIVFYTIFFLKAHQFLSDTFMSIILFSVIGIFLKFRYLDTNT